MAEPAPGVVLYVWPHFQVVKDGKPLIGGKLWTMDANTTTPKAAYHDSFLISPHENPIILDDQGSADIYLSGFYHLRQEDREGVPLWDIPSFSFATGAPPPMPGDVVQGMTEQTVSAINNASVIPVSGLVPTGYRCKGVIVRIDTGFGTSNGLVSIHIGDAILDNSWGEIGLTAGLTTTQRSFLRGDEPIAATAYTVLLSAVGGLFDSAGVMTLRATWESLAGWS